MILILGISILRPILRWMGCIMTIVACWVNAETNPPQVCAVSDSRISAPDGSVISDSVAKIFSLPIVSRRPSASGHFDQIYYAHSFGLAVAGSALLSLNLNALLVPVLSNLICVPQGQDLAIPSLEDVASVVARLHTELCRQIGVTAGNRALSEAVVFGYCHRFRRYRIFRLSPVDGSAPLTVCCQEQDTSARETVLLLGVGQHEMAQRIADARARATSEIAWWRAPDWELRKVVASAMYPSVGGAIQLARASEHGTLLFASLEPINPGQAAATMKYLGLDLDGTVGMVGPCRSAMIAQA